MKKPLLQAFLVGAVMIFFIRLVVPTLWGAFGAALAAVFVVCSLYRYYSKRKVKERDRAADDLYYLGLLLTLVSLIYALVLLFALPGAGTGPDVQGRIDTLIGNFGIALVSTVAGILFRILLQDASQVEPDSTRAESRERWPEAPDKPPDPAETGDASSTARLTAQMREAVASTTQLRRDLHEAADAFAHFTRVTLSHANHVKSHTQKLLEDFNQHMVVVAERGLDDTGEAWRRVGETMRQDGQNLLHNVEESVSGAAERTEEAWRNLAGQIESAAVAAQGRLQANAEEIGTTLTQLATANGSLGSLTSAFGDAERHVSTLAQRAAAASAALDADTRGMKASQASVIESFEAAAAALAETFSKQVAEQTRAWQRALDEFDAAGQAQRQRNEHATAAAQRAIEALSAGLATAERDVAALGRLASGTESHTAEALAALSGLAEDARQQQAASLRAWHDATSRFSEEARAHVAKEVNAWRELLEGFDTSANARRLSEETSRLAGLIEQLQRLLPAATVRRKWWRRSARKP